jgi:hypothetical protein
LEPKELVRLHESRIVVLERGAAHAFGVHVQLEAFESAVSLGQAVLQDALESGFGVALATAAAILLFEAAVTAANAVLEEQASQGKSRGNDGAAAERVPQGIRVHAPGLQSLRSLF